MKILLLFIVFLILPGAGHTQALDDSDISSRSIGVLRGTLESEGRREGRILVFPAQRLSPSSGRDAVYGRSLYGVFLAPDDKGNMHPGRFAQVSLKDSKGVAAQTRADSQGHWTLELSPGLKGRYSIRFRLDNKFWKFEHNGSYEWEGPSVTLPLEGPVDTGTYGIAPDAENAQAAQIHQAYIDTVSLFEGSGAGIGWWKKTVNVVWPGSGDYYSPWRYEINLTNGKAWDVNIHELGHFIMHVAVKSRSGGGQHYFDRCYDDALAWTEGFPTFLAAAVRLDKNGADPTFEYLVPRRAPVQIENIPGDVCIGPTNEWRVAAALWDLFDTHEDGNDRFNMEFNRLWGAIALKRSTIPGFNGAFELLKDELSSEEIPLAKAAVDHALFWTPGPGLAGFSIIPKITFPALTSFPDFDGCTKTYR
ncbi:hypothetical protein ACFL6Y_08880 [Elusimicrobiota bacterium]